MPWHHVIPRHEWMRRFGNLKGFNSKDNQVNLSLENHTQLHCRMGDEGSEYDRIAALGMSKQIGKEEIHRLLAITANKGNQRCVGKKHPKEQNQEHSKFMKGKRYTLGLKWNEDSRRK